MHLFRHKGIYLYFVSGARGLCDVSYCFGKSGTDLKKAREAVACVEY